MDLIVPHQPWPESEEAMPTADSLEAYEKSFWAEVGENEPALRAFITKRRTRPPAEWEDPRVIVNREVNEVFRAGVSKYVRKALWHFLEQERQRRSLTQDQLAQKAGISQPAYAKIRHGETSFESILMVLRALGIEWRSVPSPSAGEQTAEGLLVALDFVQRVVLGRDVNTFKPRRESIEWLLYLQASEPWLEALAGEDEEKGEIVARCLGAAISIRLGRSIPARTFEELVAFWENWITAWELCVGAVWFEDRGT